MSYCGMYIGMEIAILELYIHIGSKGESGREIGRVRKEIATYHFDLLLVFWHNKTGKYGLMHTTYI